MPAFLVMIAYAVTTAAVGAALGTVCGVNINDAMLKLRIVDEGKERSELGYIYAVDSSGEILDRVCSFGEKHLSLGDIRTYDVSYRVKNQYGDALPWIAKISDFLPDTTKSNVKDLSEVPYVLEIAVKQRDITEDRIVEALDTYRKNNQSCENDIAKKTSSRVCLKYVKAIYEIQGNKPNEFARAVEFVDGCFQPNTNMEVIPDPYKDGVPTTFFSDFRRSLQAIVLDPFRPLLPDTILPSNQVAGS